MNNKEFKGYKKELKGASPHRKISNALASSIHGIKAPMEMRKKLEKIKKDKIGMAHKMSHNNLGWHERSDRYPSQQDMD